MINECSDESMNIARVSPPLAYNIVGLLINVDCIPDGLLQCIGVMHVHLSFTKEEGIKIYGRGSFTSASILC